MFSKTKIETSMKDIYAKIQEADAIVIGAGAGLSTAAGYEYGGKRFKKYFSDFEEKYGETWNFILFREKFRLETARKFCNDNGIECEE